MLKFSGVKNSDSYKKLFLLSDFSRPLRMGYENVSRYPLGGYDYIQKYPYQAWPFLLVAGTCSVVGTIGNIFVVLSLIVNKNLRNRRNIFIANLALADFIVTSVGDPFSVIGK